MNSSTIIDPLKVRQYSRLGVPPEVIARMFEYDEVAMRGQCEQELIVGHAEFQSDIATFQYNAAQKLNVPMLIWLGRNELGQCAIPSNEADSQPEPELEPKVG